MHSSSTARYVRRSVRQAVAVAWIATTQANTFAYAQNMTPHRTVIAPARSQSGNFRLSIAENLSPAGSDVADGQSQRPRPKVATLCGSAESAQPDSLVIDPIADHERSPTMSLDEVSQAPTPWPSLILLRGGVHHLRGPLIVTGSSGAVVIQACPGETAVIEAPATGPAVVLINSRHAALIGLVFAGPTRDHVVLDGAEDCLLERNTFSTLR